MAELNPSSMDTPVSFDLNSVVQGRVADRTYDMLQRAYFAMLFASSYFGVNPTAIPRKVATADVATYNTARTNFLVELSSALTYLKSMIDLVPQSYES